MNSAGTPLTIGLAECRQSPSGPTRHSDVRSVHRNLPRDFFFVAKSEFPLLHLKKRKPPSADRAGPRFCGAQDKIRFYLAVLCSSIDNLKIDA